MTVYADDDMMQGNKEMIEVALFNSTYSDATGAGEEMGKGGTPKEEMSCESNLGHMVKNCMTVIRKSGCCAIGYIQ